jgi:peptide/nickel transport system permease protein
MIDYSKIIGLISSVKSYFLSENLPGKGLLSQDWFSLLMKRFSLHGSLYGICAVLLIPFIFIQLNYADVHLFWSVIYIIGAIILFSCFLVLTLYERKFRLLAGLLLLVPMLGLSFWGALDLKYYNGRAAVSSSHIASSPSEHFFMGTDYEGRDVLATIIIGSQNAYIIAISGAFVATIMGVFFAVFSSSKNILLKLPASTIIVFFEIVPQIIFIIIVLGVFNFWFYSLGGNNVSLYAYSIPLTSIVIGLTSMPSVARIVENSISNLKAERFISALQSSGVSKLKILLYNILWNNSLPLILIQFTTVFGTALLTESAIGYIFEIGFGDLGTGGYLSLGKLLAEARRSILFGEKLWIIMPPIIITVISILGVNIIGDTLAEE